MDYNYMNRYDILELLQKQPVLLSYDENSETVKLNVLTNMFGLPWKIVERLHASTERKKTLDVLNYEIATEWTNILLSVNNDTISVLYFSLYVHNQFMNVPYDPDQDVKMLYLAARQLLLLCAPIREIDLSGSIEMVRSRLNKHITWWGNFNDSNRPTNGYYHLWDTYNMEHYHVANTYEETLDLMLYNLRRTWLDTTSTKRRYYGIACEKPNYSANQLETLYRIQELFGYPSAVGQGMLLTLSYSDIEGHLRCGNGVPLNIFSISAEHYKQECELSSNVRTNVIIARKRRDPVYRETQSYNYDKIPSGKMSNLEVQPEFRNTDLTLYPSTAFFAINKVPTTFGVYRSNPPQAKWESPSLRDVAKRLYAQKEDASPMAALVYLLSDASYTISLVPKIANDVTTYSWPKVQLQKVTSQLIVHDLTKMYHVLRWLTILFQSDRLGNTLSINLHNFALLADVLNRITPLIVTQDQGDLGTRVSIINTEFSDFVSQDTHPGQAFILTSNKPLYPLPIAPAVSLYHAPGGYVGIVQAIDFGVGSNDSKNMFAAVPSWTPADILDLERFQQGALLPTILPDNYHYGFRYRLTGPEYQKNDLIGIASMYGRGVARSSVVDNVRLISMRGVCEPSRLALQRRVGQFLKYHHDLPNLLPGEAYLLRNPVFSAPELITYGHKLMIYHAFKNSHMVDFGSGEYYNIWMSDNKISQVDKNILTKSPVESIINYQYDITEKMLPSIPGDVALVFNSLTFIPADNSSKNNDFLKTLIVYLVTNYRDVYINVPYFSAKSSILVSDFSKKYISSNGTNTFLRLGGYAPVYCFDDSVFDILNEFRSHNVLTFEELQAGSSVFNFTTNFFNRSVSTSTILEAMFLELHLPLFHLKSLVKV